ncbi:hypothetical protein M438DRAFT_378105 [Aureobasidium pullulans EXF-150]|uniref:Uncharacterized protein n=1 Tax=Aureobasidium pullulans EXF-150 TaxID=1043002 RepID=A0A074XYC1_AURPU|nr:uncharacterized protein M438DRAFT_378105 [Aureobasidium pullulans EXF-150]KEQ79661.1 hypothetical protein M438DRAFT_378105 [Aureobasidium pullulans EXF-150]
MALSSHTSAPSSPFPETPVALARPSHAAVRSTNYDNYNTAFSEDTSYNSTYTSASPSASPSRSLSYSSRTVSAAFGKQVLSAISENVNPGVVATVGSLSRKASLHARARSLVSFVPAFNPTDTEEQNGSSRSPPRKGPSFTDIFTPRRSSLAPSEPEEESEYIMSYKSSFTAGSGRIPQPQAPAPKPSSRSFSWFGSTKTAPVSPPTQAEGTVGMDLLNPATSLLFPVGLPSEKTPTSFDELLTNAEFLINRLQTAYKEQASALQAARAEREAQSEETEEATTRAQHLKLQLENLAAQSAEQAATNRALAEELAAEKQRRHEDREHFERMARQNDLTPRGNRHSGASSLHSDSGFESEADTAESCSRPLTPTSPHPHNYALNNNERWGTVMEPIKEVRPVSRDSTTARIPGRTCEIDAGVWMFMRDEKTRLERRVQELEGVLDGCLDLIA